MKSKLLRAMLDCRADKSIGNYCGGDTAGEIFLKSGAGEGNRTLVSSLENCRSTIELRPLARFGTANLQRLAAGKSYRPHFSCQLAGENQTAALFF